MGGITMAEEKEKARKQLRIMPKEEEIGPFFPSGTSTAEVAIARGEDVAASEE
jgi:hypothetical protein